MKQEAARVYVVDDDPDVGQAVAYTLTSVGYAVETCLDADAFLSHATVSDSAVALIDMLLPGMSGLALCREIAKRRMPCGYAVISGHADVSSAVEAMRLGAVDVLEKPFSHLQLISVVDKALHVARVNKTKREEEDDAIRRLANLTPRERCVFDAVAIGLATREIAAKLGNSARTIDVHRSRIMQKLGIKSPLQLAHFISVLARCDNYALTATSE